MSMVQQTPDGLLIVRDTASGKTYIDTGANAALDFGIPTPALDAGATDRVYDVGVRHAMTNGVTIISGGPVPWTVGDNYIAAINGALTNQANRRASAPQPPPPDGT